MENSDKQKILIVDDEASIIDYLRLGFKYEGFVTASATSGQEALSQVKLFAPDLVVLDRMLGDMDGLEVCSKIREFSELPVLMLSARGEVEDRVAGLNQGADDYLPKPFEFEELLARVRALLRRGGTAATPTTSSKLSYGPLEMDPEARRLRVDGETVELTAREFDLLHHMLSQPGRVLTKEQLITHLWGYDFEGNTSVVEVHISAIRQKLGDHDKTLIRTVRGVGYALGD